MDLSLSYRIGKFHILQRDEFEIANLDSCFEADSPAYLYFILSKNRVCINHKYVDFTNDYIKTEFLVHNKGEIISEQINFKNPYNDLKELKVVSEFPYNEFKIVDESGSSLIVGKSAYFLEHQEAYGQVKNKDLLDYEILYIGQSVLSDNNVPVLNRITAHKTFQKILEDYNKSNPDKELFSFFLSFKQDALIDIPENLTDEDREIFVGKFKKFILNSTIKEIKQNVTLFEASLINFFKPKYNSDFIDKAPSKSHLSFRGLSEMNLNKVNVFWGIENFHPRLYTNSVEKNSEYIFEHIIQ